MSEIKNLIALSNRHKHIQNKPQAERLTKKSLRVSVDTKDFIHFGVS